VGYSVLLLVPVMNPYLRQISPATRRFPLTLVPAHARTGVPGAASAQTRGCPPRPPPARPSRASRILRRSRTECADSRGCFQCQWDGLPAIPRKYTALPRSPHPRRADARSATSIRIPACGLESRPQVACEMGHTRPAVVPSNRKPSRRSRCMPCAGVRPGMRRWLESVEPDNISAIPGPHPSFAKHFPASNLHASFLCHSELA